MQATVRRMSNALARLGAAVESMQGETVACRRNLMVFRARMDCAERLVARMGASLDKSFDLLTTAEAEARHAAALFRATAQGRSAA